MFKKKRCFRSLQLVFVHVFIYQFGPWMHVECQVQTTEVRHGFIQTDDRKRCQMRTGSSKCSSKFSKHSQKFVIYNLTRFLGSRHRPSEPAAPVPLTVAHSDWTSRERQLRSSRRGIKIRRRWRRVAHSSLKKDKRSRLAASLPL